MEHLEALAAASGGIGSREGELRDKYARLARWFAESRYDGLLLRRHENLAWVTGGQVEVRVAILSETGVAAIVLLRDGRRFYLTPDNEADRLAQEEFAGLGYEPVIRPWHTLDMGAEAKALAGAKLASDTAMDGLPIVDLRPLRAPLLEPEGMRFRALGRATAEAVSDVLRSLHPGVSEYEMEAWTAQRLLGEGVFPSVLLMAVDDRILRYKHAVARGGRLKRFGMLNLCARRWGLAVSITRFVHFGPLPPELARGFAVAAQVNAALQHATREGAGSSDLFRIAAGAYAGADFAGEEQRHHQGGACGYLERDWVATPSGVEVVRASQAFAWNPSCRGGKVEDTTLLSGDSIEVLTSTPLLPEVVTEFEKVPYVSAGVLQHD